MKVPIRCGGYGSRLGRRAPVSADDQLHDYSSVSDPVRALLLDTAAVDLREELRRTIASYRALSLSGEPNTQRAAP